MVATVWWRYINASKFCTDISSYKSKKSNSICEEMFKREDEDGGGDG